MEPRPLFVVQKEKCRKRRDLFTQQREPVAGYGISGSLHCDLYHNHLLHTTLLGRLGAAKSKNLPVVVLIPLILRNQIVS